jgi:F-type H+-transporting ATPase subunit b
MNLIFFAIRAAEAGEGGGVFNLNLGVSAWTFIIFILLLILLKRFAFPPILDYAAARERRIQETLDIARQQREETERLLAEQREELANARQHAQEMIAEGRAGAERVREDMLEQARQEQQDILARAQRDILAARDVAIESLRREAVDIALAAAAKVVGHHMTGAEDRKLVTEYLRSVDSVGGGNGAGAA